MLHAFMPLPQKCEDEAFLDALLSAARLEMFMPGVDIVSKDDQVSELYIIVRGTVKVTVMAQLHACKAAYIMNLAHIEPC